MKRRRLQYGTGMLFVSFLVVTICFGTNLHLVDQMDKNRIMDNAVTIPEISGNVQLCQRRMKICGKK